MSLTLPPSPVVLLLRRSLLLLALLAAALPVATAPAAGRPLVVRGVVVHHAGLPGGFVIANAHRRLVTLRAAHAPAIGRRVSARVHRVGDGTFAVDALTVSRRPRERRVAISGTVTFTRPGAGFTVSAGGASLLVRDPRAEPERGTDVRVRGVLQADGRLTARAVHVAGRHRGPVVLGGYLLGADLGRGRVYLSADDRRASGAAIAIRLPRPGALPAFAFAAGALRPDLDWGRLGTVDLQRPPRSRAPRFVVVSISVPGVPGTLPALRRMGGAAPSRGTPRATPAPGTPPASSPGLPASPPTGQSAAVALSRPYADSSPWNTPIPADVAVDPKSATYVKAISDNGEPLTSDPDQYAVGVYTADASTPHTSVYLYRQYYVYGADDTHATGYYWKNHPANIGTDMDGNHVPAGAGPTWAGVPVPAGTVPSTGTDGHTVILDTSTGMEYGFWRFDNLTSSSPVGPFNGFAIPASATHNAWDGYRYQVNDARHLGICRAASCGRASGNPLLAGLVRKWEIDQGHIDHAIAFAYKEPAPNYRYPAASGYSGGSTGTDLPLGGRLQLDPSLSDATIQGWGCTGACLVIAHALQQYGMYATDASGSSKIYLEDRATAHWDSSITRSLVSGIPWSAFRVVAPPAG